MANSAKAGKNKRKPSAQNQKARTRENKIAGIKAQLKANPNDQQAADSLKRITADFNRGKEVATPAAGKKK